MEKFLETIEFENPQIIESKLVLESLESSEESVLNITSPMFILFFISILIILITFRDFKNNKQTKVLDISANFNYINDWSINKLLVVY